MPVPILVICKHLYSQTHKNTFITTENPKYLNEFFLISKNFLFGPKINFNPKVIYYIFLMKMFQAFQ